MNDYVITALSILENPTGFFLKEFNKFSEKTPVKVEPGDCCKFSIEHNAHVYVSPFL